MCVSRESCHFLLAGKYSDNTEHVRKLCARFQEYTQHIGKVEALPDLDEVKVLLSAQKKSWTEFFSYKNEITSFLYESFNTSLFILLY